MKCKKRTYDERQNYVLISINIALLHTTNSWKFNDVDYSKGVFIAANTYGAHHQTVDVYYYSSNMVLKSASM
jgi:hypothetical protein